MRMRSVGRKSLTAPSRPPRRHGNARAGVDAVPRTHDGVDDRRLAELAPQRHHRDPHRGGERVGVLVPYPVEQLLAAHDGALRREQCLQDAELLAGQLDQLAVAGDRALGGVELDVAGGQHRRRRRRGATAERAHPRDQFGERERLGQVVVGAERQPGHLVLDGAARGQHHAPASARPRRSAGGRSRRPTCPAGRGRAPRRRTGSATPCGSRRRRRWRRRPPCPRGAGRGPPPRRAALRPRRRGCASSASPVRRDSLESASSLRAHRIGCVRDQPIGIDALQLRRPLDDPPTDVLGRETRPRLERRRPCRASRNPTGMPISRVGVSTPAARSACATRAPTPPATTAVLDGHDQREPAGPARPAAGSTGVTQRGSTTRTV